MDREGPVTGPNNSTVGSTALAVKAFWLVPAKVGFDLLYSDTLRHPWQHIL